MKSLLLFDRDDDDDDVVVMIFEGFEVVPLLLSLPSRLLLVSCNRCPVNVLSGNGLENCEKKSNHCLDKSCPTGDK